MHASVSRSNLLWDCSRTSELKLDKRTHFLPLSRSNLTSTYRKAFRGKENHGRFRRTLLLSTYLACWPVTKHSLKTLAPSKITLCNPPSLFSLSIPSFETCPAVATSRLALGVLKHQVAHFQPEAQPTRLIPLFQTAIGKNSIFPRASCIRAEDDSWCCFKFLIYPREWGAYRKEN